ncbi:hypothetical protein [Mycobacterium hubeiense]|uniref:hypothetical protein n=1 Tax=Mycobacterium hubeiense TaxID=1867256 RepID=UPI000C7F50EE|nr:hypothetical protein [Mycobacterium sp. QGD 101]
MKRLLVVGAALLMLGCSPDTADQAEIVEQAKEFGDITLPADAEVLQARHDRGPDVMYHMAIKTTPDGADQIVEASSLEPQPDSDALPGMIYTVGPLAGPALQPSPQVRSWRQRHTNSAGEAISRAVTVDSRESPTVYVHLTLSTVS